MAGDSPTRRRFYRVPTEHYVLVRKPRQKELPRVTKTGMIGRGGCMFVLDAPQGVDTILSLQILLGKSVVDVKARVAYELRREDGAFEIGAEFLEITTEDKAVLERSLPAGAPPERLHRST